MSLNANLEPLDFFIAEDQVNMQELMKSMLMSLGVVNIRMAKDGSDAFAQLLTKPSDIIFVDWLMKPTSGIDLVRLIRGSENPAISNMPVIMVTANCEQECVKEAMDAGATDYLLKPISPQLLQLRIEKIFPSKQDLSSPNTELGNDEDDTFWSHVTEIVPSQKQVLLKKFSTQE